MINKFNSFEILRAYKKLKDIKKENYNINKKEKIVVSMIPYPSGVLHIGHARNYIANDIICRYYKKIGIKSDMFFGWDSFGLPAENASIKESTTPDRWIKKNIKYMKKQIENMEIDINWKYEIDTSNPKFYRFSQFFFKKLFEKGFIYKSNYIANWDPVDKTVLANEQVIKNKGWRSNSKIEKIFISSYFIKVKPIIKNIIKKNKTLKWPKEILNSQNNWIGEKKVYFIKFKNEKNILFFEKKSCLSKNFFFVTSINSKIVSNTIKLERIKKFLNGKKKIVKTKIFIRVKTKKFILYGFLYIDKEFPYDFIMAKKCYSHICKKYIISKKIIFKRKKIFRIKDWCISRQRYWGTPIPIINCKRCGLVLNNIPVLLPIKKFKNYDLSKDHNFYDTKCKKCGKKAKKETNTLDTFFDSSWYFYNFILKNKINIDTLKKLKKIDIYIGGKEHTILHLLYSRIFMKLLNKCKILKIKEPFKKVILQGMVLKKVLINNRETIKKMSKSDKGNVSPDLLINKYGVDSFRMSIMFSCSLKKDFIWDDKLILGCFNFIKKVWNFFFKIDLSLEKKIIKTNKVLTLRNKILYSYKKKKINKVISFCMEYFNEIVFFYKKKRNIIKDYLNLLIYLNPICPCFTDVLKHYIECHLNNIDEKKIFTRKYNIFHKLVLQINGKKKEVFYKKNPIEFYKLKYIKKYNLINYKKYVYVKNKIINFVI
ncbi:class I tRNA ligase family protein [Candidatus Vidania fulgoroideorum]